MTYKLSERAKEVRKAIESRPCGTKMTAQEMETAKLITRSFRCVEIGMTALHALKIPGIEPTVYQYAVMAFDEDTFDIFGKDLPHRCFEGTVPTGGRVKIYGDRMIAVHSYDPEIWDGRKVVPTVEQIYSWYKKHPQFKSSYVSYYLDGPLKVYSEIHKEPWFSQEIWDFYVKVRKFDSYYAYSDSVNTWRSGLEQHKVLSKLFGEIPNVEKILDYVEFTPLK